MGSRTLFVAHVIHQLHMGGMENGLVNLINRLPHERFKHLVVCIEDFSEFARRIERPDVEVIALHRSKIGVWSLRAELFKLFRRVRPDIVHTRNLSGLDALLPARLAGRATVHSEHGFDLDNLKGTAPKPTLLRRLHRPLVDQYVCVSRDLERVMVEHWHIPASRIRQIYNGVDTDRFQPARPPRRDLLPQPWRDRPSFVVGTVGRVQAVKDQATLLRAVAAAGTFDSALRARLRVAVVGDGPLLGELRELAATLGIASNCWFPGARDDVADLMQHLDLFVLPSLNEGISNTVLEAMATGLPMLVTAVGGNVELVTEGQTGESFTPGDTPRLAAMIAGHASQPALCRSRSLAARERAMAAFSLKAMVSGYQNVYESL